MPVCICCHRKLRAELAQPVCMIAVSRNPSDYILSRCHSGVHSRLHCPCGCCPHLVCRSCVSSSSSYVALKRRLVVLFDSASSLWLSNGSGGTLHHEISSICSPPIARYRSRFANTPHLAKNITIALIPLRILHGTVAAVPTVARSLLFSHSFSFSLHISRSRCDVFD